MKHNQKGFVLLELMVGLVALLVLTTIPRLQKNSADVDLKNYISKIAGGATEYMSNNNGRAPNDLIAIRKSITNSNYEGWSNAGAIATGVPAKSTIYYGVGYTCDQKTQLMTPGGKRAMAFVVQLPSGKSHCVEA